MLAEVDVNDMIARMDLQDIVTILVEQYTPFSDPRSFQDINDEIAKVLEGSEI